MRFLSLRQSLIIVLVLAIFSFLYPECETNEGGRECFRQNDFVRGTHVILLPSRNKKVTTSGQPERKVFKGVQAKPIINGWHNVINQELNKVIT